jgi:endonuclease/exonuclease/phosphatase family metal-dependent hydrolase
MVRSKFERLLPALLVAIFGMLDPPSAAAQWDPWNGQWEKSHELDVRIMTWNVGDGICSTNFKTEAFNNWTALAVIIAALKPDILLLQEAGDNSGNGTGTDGDSVDDLLTALALFFSGGLDPFHNQKPVTAFVRKYAPHHDLPHVFVSEETDGYNRNVILSRFPFQDLNGDSRSLISDIPLILPHAYAPGGTGGVRGFQFAEIRLPRWTYAGDLVVGNGHLKAGQEPEDLQARLGAAQNVAYFIDHLYNGAGTGLPDPHDKILDWPAAQEILEEATPVIIGGDWNEDESLNGRDGPALWLVRAEMDELTGLDGTDRDGTDSLLDDARHPITGYGKTHVSGKKLDYLARQDCIAFQRREFLFDTKYLEPGQMPEEVLNFPSPVFAGEVASDHKPVIVDLKLGGAAIIPAIPLFLGNPLSSEAEFDQD